MKSSYKILWGLSFVLWYLYSSEDSHIKLIIRCDNQAIQALSSEAITIMLQQMPILLTNLNDVMSGGSPSFWRAFKTKSGSNGAQTMDGS